MPDVHLVTTSRLPAPDDETATVAAALDARGVPATVVEWDEPGVDWSAAPVTVLRSPWNYPDCVDDFFVWLGDAEGVTALWNPAPLVRWNHHKSYLLHLHAVGIPIVPTVALPARSAADLGGILDIEGWNETVVKPAVGVGARGSGRYEVGDPRGQAHLAALLLGHDVLVQPYVPSIAAGEVSVVLVDGEVLHAVRKVPATGDYRVHVHHGGTVAAEPVTAELAELALAATAAAPAPTMYARVDIVEWCGTPVVGELEVFEPRLYLDDAPCSSLERFVDAISARVAALSGVAS